MGEKKSVRFDRLHIRTHRLILGDNPAVTIGAPLSIDWEPIQQQIKGADDGAANNGTSLEDVYTVDDYERIRPRRKVTYRRPGHRGPSWIFLVRSAVDREKILERAGVNNKEIQKAMREVNRVKRNRWLSLKWYFHPLRTTTEFPGNVVRFFRHHRIERQRRRFLRQQKLQSRS